MTPTHHLHEIGRTECVEHGCEPQISPAPVLPLCEVERRELARRMGNSRQAHAAAARIVETVR